MFTAWARIAGDKHFLVDVTAGGLIGAGSALLTVNLLEQDNDDQLSLVLDSESVGLKYRFLAYLSTNAWPVIKKNQHKLKLHAQTF